MEVGGKSLAPYNGSVGAKKLIACLHLQFVGDLMYEQIYC